MRAATRRAPVWIHFGPGNIFRAFPAMLQQRLLNAGLAETGIIVAEGYDYELIDAVYTPFDNLSILITLKADGGTEQTLVASVAESLKADIASPNWLRLLEIFASPSLQMVSFTITEKGYNQSGPPEDSPEQPRSYIGKVAALLRHRWQVCAAPLAMVSMDNCSKNGDRLRDAMSVYVTAWGGGFEEYVLRDITFPWTMIDKITPRPTIAPTGLVLAGLVTGKGTYAAPFVNAEELEYLVIEDAFPNGRPFLERAGAYLTDRSTVHKAEAMKVCACLNPLHTALAVFGCLLGYRKISDELRDPLLLRLIEQLGYAEGLPVAADPGIVSPKAFLDAVIKVRLPNPFVPDTPQRIATDTSQKIPVRFGSTIRAYAERADLSVDGLVAIPLTIAAWLRYLVGLDDAGAPFAISDDPAAIPYSLELGKLKLSSQAVPPVIRQILSNSALFGADLYSVRLGERIEEYWQQMMDGAGAVRRTLKNIFCAR
jgi:fructuronate reductase